MAPQCAPYMIPTPPNRGDAPANNQAAVAGLLRQKYRESQMRAARVPAQTAPTTSTSGPSPPSGCPMHAGGSGSSDGGASSTQATSINPANNMPFNLALPSSSSSSSSSASGSNVKLSRERVVSSIPRGATSPLPGASPYDAPAPPSACPVAHGKGKDADTAPSRWEYPSAEQFQAALARKNKAAPEEHVEMMVAVHNFMNEEAWKIVVEWEKEFGTDTEDLSLLRFQGRPGELSPRARWYGFMGSIWPSRYSSTPPFDRHDWIIGRPDGTTARYVIDYYGDDEADARDEQRRLARERDAAVKRGSSAMPRTAGEEEDEEDDDQARFILDIRPALDSFEAIRVRARRAFRESMA